MQLSFIVFLNPLKKDQQALSLKCINPHTALNDDRLTTHIEVSNPTTGNLNSQLLNMRLYRTAAGHYTFHC